MLVKVLLADDHKMVRAGLRSILEKEPGISVIAEADNGREAVQLACDLLPDVAVMDISMPDMNGIEAIRRVVAEQPSVRTLALSMHSDRRIVLEALKAGAKGYLLKDAVADELVTAIRTLAAGEIYICSAMAQVVLKDYLQRSPETISAVASPLSPREREVLQLVAEGKNTKEVAFTLGVSVKTVETHRQQIMKKLNMFSVAELTKYAIREGLTSLE
jgi:DNA-binding NarL/FixJ family response regulator